MKKFLVEKEWFPSDTQDIQGFTKLPAAPILPVFFLFPSKSELLLPHATTESLSNYPAIHAKPNSPLAFPLMNFIKPQCETRRLHPKARVFRSVGVYQLGKVMWRNYNRRSSDPFLLSCLAARRRSVRNLKLLTHMDLKHSHCYKQLLLVQFFFFLARSPLEDASGLKKPKKHPFQFHPFLAWFSWRWGFTTIKVPLSQRPPLKWDRWCTQPPASSLTWLNQLKVVKMQHSWRRFSFFLFAEVG